MSCEQKGQRGNSSECGGGGTKDGQLIEPESLEKSSTMRADLFELREDLSEGC